MRDFSLVPSSSVNSFLYSIIPAKTLTVHPSQLGRDQKATADSNGTASKCLGAGITSRARNNGTCYRGPCQHGEANNGKDHAHAHTELAQVRGEKRQSRGEKTLDASADNTINNDPSVKPGGAVDGDEAEYEDGGDDGRRDEDVDGADAVGDEVGNDTADDADAVEDEQQVERIWVREWRVEGVTRVCGYVEEGKIHAPEVLVSISMAPLGLEMRWLTKKAAAA